VRWGEDNKKPLWWQGLLVQLETFSTPSLSDA